MAEPYVANLATSYVQTNDQNGDPEGKNFNGGMILSPISNEVRSPITTDSPQAEASEAEDPLFTSIAGNSQEFVGGIPKEKWDSMSPEQRDLLVRGTEDDRRKAAIIGGGIGAGLGYAASIPITVANPIAGGIASGVFSGAGGTWGAYKGYDLLDKATPPQPVSRDVLRQQFQYAKEHD